jgi:heterodisulfide reductase subunit B2
MSIGYYPGCSLHGTAGEYDLSLRAVAAHLNIELREIPNWVCCGATSAHAVDHQAALCLAADTLAKAHAAGIDQILAPCAMCYQRLASAGRDLSQSPDLGAKVATALGESPDLPWQKLHTLSVLHWLEQLPAEQIRAKIAQPLKGLKVACYYGCLLVRPASLTGATNVEAPRQMERLLDLLGATTVRWSMAMECCGGSFALSRRSVVLRQAQRIYDAAAQAGADVLCMACPMCQANLDMRQKQIETPSGKIPALYLTQLLGLAFGLPRTQLGLNRHFVRAEAVLDKAMAAGTAS